MTCPGLVREARHHLENMRRNGQPLSPPALYRYDLIERLANALEKAK